MSKIVFLPEPMNNHHVELRTRFYPMEGHDKYIAEVYCDNKHLICEIFDKECERDEFMKNLKNTPISTLCKLMDGGCYKPSAFDNWKIRHHIKPTHVEDIRPGDVIVVQGVVKTVGKSDIKHDHFTGTSIYGDNFMNGYKFVNLIRPENIGTYKLLQNGVI